MGHRNGLCVCVRSDGLCKVVCKVVHTFARRTQKVLRVHTGNLKKYPIALLGAFGFAILATSVARHSSLCSCISPEYLSPTRARDGGNLPC